MLPEPGVPVVGLQSHLSGTAMFAPTLGAVAEKGARGPTTRARHGANIRSVHPIEHTGEEPGRIARMRETLCTIFGHRWTAWERPLRLVETCHCTRCGRTRTRRLGLV
jgi:hypothetical protein